MVPAVPTPRQPTLAGARPTLFPPPRRPDRPGARGESMFDAVGAANPWSHHRLCQIVAAGEAICAHLRDTTPLEVDDGLYAAWCQDIQNLSNWFAPFSALSHSPAGASCGEVDALSDALFAVWSVFSRLRLERFTRFAT